MEDKQAQGSSAVASVRWVEQRDTHHQQKHLKTHYAAFCTIVLWVSLRSTHTTRWV